MHDCELGNLNRDLCRFDDMKFMIYMPESGQVKGKAFMRACKMHMLNISVSGDELWSGHILIFLAFSSG